MMILKLQRDDARMLKDNFFRYLRSLVETKIRDSISEMEFYSWKILRSLFEDIHKIISRKLLTDAVKFKMKFTDAEGIALWRLLMLMPVQQDQFYMLQLRTTVCNTLYLQMSEPV